MSFCVVCLFLSVLCSGQQESKQALKAGSGRTCCSEIAEHTVSKQATANRQTCIHHSAVRFRRFPDDVLGVHGAHPSKNKLQTLSYASSHQDRMLQPHPRLARGESGERAGSIKS